MPVADWIGELVGGGASKIVDSVTDGVKKFITTEADRQQFELAKQGALLDVQKLVMAAESEFLKDRQSARQMYEKDSSLQKTFALTFLGGYVVLTVAMLYFIIGWIGKQGIVIPDWAVALISTIYGAMSTKVNTIVDFLFGSSSSSRAKDDVITALRKQ